MEYSVLPADKYKVINKTLLSDLDKDNIVRFYTPIIGPIATSLYLDLWQDLNKKNTTDEYLIHNHLLSLLKCSPNAFVEARESLEAVGLLKTYVKEENVLVYLYELYSPLSPVEFFNHPILNVVLYNNIGSDEYDSLLKEYQKVKVDYTGFSEITKNLDDVYASENFNKVANLQDKQMGNITVTSKIDYDLIANSIPKDVLSDKAFNKKNRELIDNLSFIYHVDSLQMVEFIRKSLNEYGMIDKETLRNTVKKYYEYSFNSLPTLVYRTQPEYLKKPAGDNSLHGKIVAMFENTTPYDFLKRKNGGTKPTTRDLNLVERLLNDLGLTTAVVNVLLDYCLKTNNNKLVGAYVETIAGQWKRAGLQTAEEAMQFAIKEHKKTTKKKTTEIPKKSNIPEWFNKDISSEDISEETEKEIEEMFKEFR